MTLTDKASHSIYFSSCALYVNEILFLVIHSGVPGVRCICSFFSVFSASSGQKVCHFFTCKEEEEKKEKDGR